MEDRRGKRGPKPDRVKIDGNWEEAVKKALGKERPPGGWPNRDRPEDPEERKKTPDKPSED